MIGSLLALALLTTGAETTPVLVEESPELELDPCLDIDESAVRSLVDLQLGDARLPHPPVPITVAVRCTDDGQEIRVEPWASRGEGGIRPIALPEADDAVPAAQEARSRELALAIAELIRRLEIAHPLSSEGPPSPPPPPPAPPTVAVTQSPPPPETSGGRWQLGVVSAYEHFGGGQQLAGGDAIVAARVGRWVSCELRAGGRVGDGVTLPWVRVTTRAGTVAAGVGANRWSQRRRVGLGVMLGAQGYLVEFRAQPPLGGPEGTGRAGALVLAVEPRLTVAVTRHLALVAAAAAGLPVHGAVLRIQGQPSESLSGLALSVNLGAVLTF